MRKYTCFLYRTWREAVVHRDLVFSNHHDVFVFGGRRLGRCNQPPCMKPTLRPSLNDVPGEQTTKQGFIPPCFAARLASQSHPHLVRKWTPIDVASFFRIQLRPVWVLTHVTHRYWYIKSFLLGNSMQVNQTCRWWSLFQGAQATWFPSRACPSTTVDTVLYPGGIVLRV